MLKYLNYHYSEKQPRPVTSGVGSKRILDLNGTFGRSNTYMFNNIFYILPVIPLKKSKNKSSVKIQYLLINYLRGMQVSGTILFLN